MNDALALAGWSVLAALIMALIVWALAHTTWLRQRPALRHALWLLVLAKLVVPSFASVAVLPAEQPPVAEELQFAELSSAGSATTAAEPVDSQHQHRSLTQKHVASSEPDARGSAWLATTIGTFNAYGARAWFLVLLVLSSLTSCVLAAIAIRRCRQVDRLVATSAVQSRRATALLREVADQFQLSSSPAVSVVNTDVAPMLWAVPRRATIVLPKALFDSLTDDQARSVLAHELAHYVRRDHWANLFAFCVTTLAWWNPVAWLARRQLAEAAESSCDALVVERLPGFRKCYAQTLLSVVDFVATVPARPAALAINFGESKSLRRRFETLADSRVTSRVSRYGWALLTLVAAVSLLVPVRAQKAAAEPAAPAAATSDTAKQKAEQSGANANAGWPLRVLVVDDATGEAIAEPRVSLQLGENKTSHDGDSRGEALLKLPSRTPAHCYLRVRAPGYAPMQAFWRNRAEEPADEMPDTFTFRMSKAITVGGRVIDERGNPVAGASVLFGAGNKASLTGRRAESHFYDEEYTTDIDGRWQCDLASPDFNSGSIRVNHPDFARGTGHWNVEDQIDELRAGTHEFTLQRGFTVRGRVTDVDGKPVEGAVLAVGHANWYPTGDDGAPFPKTDADGRYEFTRIGPSAGWPAGSDPKLTMTVIKPGLPPMMQRIPSWRTGPAPDAPYQDQELDFQLKRGRTLRIRVVDAAGHGIPGVRVVPEEWNETRPFFVLAKFGLPRVTDQDGVWQWTWTPPDEAIEYDVFCRGYLNVRDRQIVATDEVNEVTITLKRRQVISGRVTDASTGQPIDAFVVRKGLEFIANEPDRISWETSGETRGQNGQYTKTVTMPPHNGSYRYRAQAEGYQPQMSRSVKFEEGDVSLDFELTPLAAEE